MFLLGVCISTVVVATRFGTPKKKIIVESRDVAFFEDGLPSPALHSSPTSSKDDDEAAVQQPLEPSHGPTPADVKKPHEPLQLSAPPPLTMTTQDPVPTPKLQQHFIVRLPGRYMCRPSAQHAPILNESDTADTVPSSDENDDDEPPRPRHNVAHVADYP